ncbi:MAG: hypothetical protein IJ776_03720 [Paludibacteraceae bacterium]|nr:hypothetical protein [Paludibacteraceae bacterium]
MSECQTTVKQRQTTVNPSADGQTTLKPPSNNPQTTVNPSADGQTTVHSGGAKPTQCAS